MLRALCFTARRREALCYPHQVLQSLPSPPGDALDVLTSPGTYSLFSLCNSVEVNQTAPGVILQSCGQRTVPTNLYECLPSPSSSGSLRPREPACEQPLGLMRSAATNIIAKTNPRRCFHSSHRHQQIRWASAAAKSKARAAINRKGAASTSSPKLRTPEWAHMPLQLDDVSKVMRRCTARLLTLHGQFSADAAKAEASGWAAASKVAAAKAAAQALPIPPKDAGERELADATAPGTSFESAYGNMKELCRRGISLGAELHLAPLLRKATDAGHLAAALGLLRINHLVQAAARRGSHGARHDTLHNVLVEECLRLRTTAPLLELWGSLYEHGMEPSNASGTAAVQAAVSLRDAPAAISLLALTSQYSQEPLAGTEVPAVLALLQAESPEEAAKLRQLLPRLGLPDVA